MCLFKPKLFYLLDEHEDSYCFCRRKGMLPCDINEHGCTIRYNFKGYTYSAFETADCYSGFSLTFMREPLLSFEELLHIVLTFKREEDRLGALGVILKKYHIDFEAYLDRLHKGEIDYTKNHKKMISYVNDSIKVNCYRAPKELPNIFELCEKIALSYN